jgi:hypothetical protein
LVLEFRSFEIDDFSFSELTGFTVLTGIAALLAVQLLAHARTPRHESTGALPPQAENTVEVYAIRLGQ